jgi:uncharacterized protein (DUF1501 family)
MKLSTPITSIVANRRRFLKSTAAAIGATALPISWAQAATAVPKLGRSNKSVLFVYLPGGPSQLDMYDTKPDAPAAIRGEFRPINTNVPGVRVCEHLPLHAKIADKFAIVNGVETIDTHSASVVKSGYLPNEQRPTFAMVANSMREIGRLDAPQLDLSEPRDYLKTHLNIQEQGSAAITANLPRGAVGPAIADRLDWDTHGHVLGGSQSIFQELRATLPVYDATIHGLITDIYDRGLDQDVLVVVCGEFGRTPWINKYGGRDHWAPCGSVLFAGGGLRMGQVIGDTGPIGERERSRSTPYTAQNVLATIYRHLEIDPATTVRDGFGRSVALLDVRSPIEELI